MGAHTSRCWCRAAGLTLVELLLALALFTTLTGAVAALVISATNVQLHWGRSLEPYERLARTMERVQRDLESAQPLFGIPFIVADGGARLELARVEPIAGTDGSSATEWVKVTYRVAPADSGTVLIRDETLWRTGATEPLRRETLTPLISGRFSVGQVDSNGALAWTASWNGSDTDTSRVPRLVQFDCTLPPAGERSPVSFSRAFRNPAGILPVQKP